MSNTQAINKLRLQRGQVKGCITSVENWITEHAGNISVSEAETQLKRLKKYEIRFEEIQAQLEDLDQHELDPDHDERISFDDRLSVLESSLLEVKSLHDASFHADTTSGQISVDLVTSDLPKLDLPKFSGEYLEYPQFIDSFNALVHNVTGRGMTDTRRFGLLKSSLTGRALESVANLPMVPGNYKVALGILKERFYKQRLIFTSYVRKLWDLQKASNTSTLRNLCDSYTSLQKGLELIATQQEISCGITIQLLLTKCDHKTVEEWEKLSSTKDTLPTEQEFTEFLTKRCTQLEGVEYVVRSTSKPPQPPSVPLKPKIRVSNTSTKQKTQNDTKLSCPQCQSNHSIFKCSEFLNETPKGRYTMARHLNICVRCLKDTKGHPNCTEKCETCGSRHHGLLHFQMTSPPHGSPNDSAGKKSANSNTSENVNDTHVSNMSMQKGGLESFHDPSCDTYTFLATAVVKAQTVDGNYVPLRVLFDGGSQLNLISDRARQLLGLATSNTKHQIQLSGINNATITLRKRVYVKLQSIWSSFQDSVMLVVHPKLRQMHPDHNINIDEWKIPNDMQLADHEFNRSQPIDIILNAHQVDLYTLSKTFSLGKDLPRLRETKFGWVVVGDWSTARSNNPSYANLALETANSPDTNDLPTLLRRFWELESTKPMKFLSCYETETEKHFVDTTTRMPDGRFVVRLPFCRSPELLGESRFIAEKRLSMITRKMRNQADYGKDYIEFVTEYVNLKHCSEVDKPEVKTPHYYIPHFSVTNDNSTTTKTRVVFDASCPTDNDISLNELLMVGPKLQDDLYIHLLRFRMYAYALTGDVSKMYRQILVHEDDRKFQYILWQDPHSNDGCQTYELNTVTYGTASAPFHAVRCMQELANVDANDRPLAKQVLLRNFYVDDLLTGTDDEQTALDTYREVKEVLSRGQMNIKKFQSNSKRVMNKIPVEDHGTFLNIGSNEVLKTLGMIWDPQHDQFSYYYEPGNSQKLSRRVILSEISRLFDPLGLIQPVVIRAKLFMQRLYASTTNWDEPVSQEDAENWQNFRIQLSEVSTMKFTRPVIDTTVPKSNLRFEIHGFCDASEMAYAVAIYIRSIEIGEKRIYNEIRLLTAKTRVAPLKKMSLPKLELCGALLLSELYETIRPAIDLEIDRVYFWTDSTITFRWVTQSPHKWTPFVATRVTKIQDSAPGVIWNHIRSEQNPADLATRGMTPRELLNNSLWFFGPRFLSFPDESWPENPVFKKNDDVPERAKVVQTLLVTTDKDLLSRCKIMSFAPLISGAVWPKLKRIFGYVHRFIVNAQQKRDKSSKVVDVPLLTVDELRHGEKLIVKFVQILSFSKERTTLVKKSAFPGKSKFGKLSIFLDEEDIMRVGGRIRNSPEIPNLDEKFPYILPHDHTVTKIIFAWYHHENLHAGPTALLSFVRQRFWPIHGKVLATRTVQ